MQHQAQQQAQHRAQQQALFGQQQQEEALVAHGNPLVSGLLRGFTAL
jgi:hypothetical protein